MENDSIDTSVKKRGRPIGSGGRSSSFSHYNPKRWHPEFDLIIIESISGKTNEEISRLFGYTPQHISNILSTEKAREVKESIRERIGKEYEGGIKNRLAAIGEKAVKHIENFIEDKNGRADKDPFAFVDRAIKIAQVTGSVNDETKKSQGNMLINTGTIVISNDKADALKNALANSSSIEDVDFEVESVDTLNNKKDLVLVK